MQPRDVTERISRSAHAVSGHAALRAATAAVHERLHRVPVFAALAAGEIGRADYVALLRRLYGFHMPMESAIDAALAEAPIAGRLQGWRRTDLLRRDLRELGVDEADIDALPLLRGIVPGRGETAADEALGWLYVVEGSTLGGRMLARQLDSILSINSVAGRFFLLAGAGKDHISWHTVCRIIDEVGGEPVRLDAMIAAACFAFDCFERWFADGREAAAA
jgi:heme oxygenase